MFMMKHFQTSTLVLLLTAFTSITGVEGQSSTQALLALPSCAQTCFLPVLATLTCDITTIPSLANCICPDIDIQKSISACVQKGCNHTEQTVVINVSSNVCKGFPIPSRGVNILAVTVAMAVLSVVFVLFRCWSRVTVAKRFWWDDWMIVGATFFVIGALAIHAFLSTKGMGRHLWNVDPNNVPLILQLFYISQVFYIMVQALTKIALLLLFLRIFPQRWFRVFTIAVIYVIAIHATIFEFLIIFQCTPVASYWDKNLDSKCLDSDAIVYAGAIFSIVEDLVIIVLPIPCISTLNIGRGKKLSLLVMFGVGSFACVTSMVRLKYVVGFGSSTDATWDNVDVIVWSCVEIAVAVICACLPTLRPLLSRYCPSIFGTTAYASSYANRRKGSGALQHSDASHGNKGDKAGMRVFVNDEETRVGSGIRKEPGSPVSTMRSLVSSTGRQPCFDGNDSDQTELVAMKRDHHVLGEKQISNPRQADSDEVLTHGF